MNARIRRLLPSICVLAIFSLATLLQFWPVVTGAASISKVQQLAEWDSFFADQKSGQSMLMDPSLVYLMIPYYLLKATFLHRGHLPLWNPYSGLGCPLAADPQALAFSPLHLPLILNPGLTAYNRVLVLEIIILGLSTFGLARCLKLSLPASIFAMVAMAYCPYERWYLELLGNGYCLIPVVFWALLSLRSNLSAIKIWLAGLACAIMLLSAHPELSFFTIALATLAVFLYALFDKDSLPGHEKQTKNDYIKRLTSTAGAIAAAGLIAFMIAAPMLVPFLEFLANSDSYKFGNGAPAVVRWQTLIFDLLQPGFDGASPTFGPCAPMLIPLAFCTASKNKALVFVFMALILFGLALTGKIFPLSMILSHPPFTYLVVNYAFPAVLLLTAILAAFGLDSIIKKREEQQFQVNNIALLISIALALSVVIFPLSAKATHLALKAANFDLCLPDYAFNRNDMVRYGVFAVLAAFSLLAAKLKPLNRNISFVLIAIVSLSQIAEIITSLKSMPERPYFAYTDKEVLPKMEQIYGRQGERFIATGSHLLRANSNVVLGINDLRTHNPIFPRRYLAYMKACGAHLDQFNQEFDSPLSPLIDLAAVRLILSQSPVIGEREWQNEASGLGLISAKMSAKMSIKPSIKPSVKMSVTVPLTQSSSLRASLKNIVVDVKKAGIFANLAITADTTGYLDLLTYNLALYSNKGQILWFSDARPLKTDLKENNFVTIPVPVAKQSADLLLGMQIYDNSAARWLAPTAEDNVESAPDSKSDALKNVFMFGPVTVPYDSGDTTKRNTDENDYSLAYEAPSRLRLYRKGGSLPRAYAVHRVLITHNEKESLAAIQNPCFDPKKIVVVENPDMRPLQATTINANLSAGADQVKLIEQQSDRIKIEAMMAQPGILILSDIYYPGWDCEVDGEAEPIVRANYLMRGVKLEAGHHEVTFAFKPKSFLIGQILFFFAMAAGLIICLLAALKNGATRKTKRKIKTLK